MAKAAKREALSLDRIGIPPRLSNALLGVFGVLAIGLSLLLIWQSYQAWSRTRIEPQLDALRSQVAGRISDDTKALRERLDTTLGDAHLRADLVAREFDDAAQRVSSSWPEVTSVEFFDAGLESAYSEGLSQFGFAKLALLSAAQTRNQTVSDVVGSAETPLLGLAAPVRDDRGVIALAFVSLPLSAITGPVANARLPGGYLELRSGPRALSSHGDTSLKAQSTGTPVPGLTLQVATAAPVARTVLAYPPLVQGGIALLAMLLGGVLLHRLRRALATTKIVGIEPTFGEVLQQQVDGTEPAPRAPAKPPAKPVDHAVERSIFRAYDIRGVVGQTLNEGVARLIGQAVGTLMRSKNLREIVVGRDGRLSGPSLSNALIEGLRRTGCDVIDIGQAPTPLLYFANFQLNTGSGIAVTGSHNPPDYNGFKIVVGGETLSGDAIRDLYVSIAENRLQEDDPGGLQVMDVAADYVARVSGDIQLERRLKVVVDAGNGVAGELGPAVLEAIGAEVIPLHCDIDGEFPNHHPDPSVPENLADLITFVKKFDADLGIAFDGDGDRLGVVSREGEIIYPDRLLMLFAQDVLARNPGASVIYDVKCTSHLAGQILRHGGSPIMWKTGHSLIKAKMKETEAELAGEMSGHFFFRERWYGFDDGIYSAARLLEILAASESSPEEIFAELPKGVSTPELKIAMAEGEHYLFMEKFREQARFEGAKIATIDGIRADWPDGWGLVRCSNTTPSLVLRFDAETTEALGRIQEIFRAQLLALDPALELPF